jgi:hypothetical protein
MIDPCAIVAQDTRFRVLLAAVICAEQAGNWREAERMRDKLHEAEHTILMEILEQCRN